MQCTEMDVNKGYQLIHEFHIPGCLPQETVDRRKEHSVESYLFIIIFRSNMTMIFKSVVVVLIAILFIDEASANTCPRLVKFKKSPVCFGARNNQYGRFTYPWNIFVSSFLFVHRTGSVTCNKKTIQLLGVVFQITMVLLSSSQIIKSEYWPQLHQKLISMDGTVCQVTPPRLLSSSSVLPRSPTVSSPTPSSASGTEKIYVVS